MVQPRDSSHIKCLRTQKKKCSKRPTLNNQSKLKSLEHCALALYKPLHHLFLLSLSQHYLPSDWRTHLIFPVFKSGDKSSVCNYRPISLLCTVSKVLEKLIYNQIIHFVSASISPSQFGFRPKHSSTQQLLIFLSFIQDSLASNSQADVIYLDFKKAFDNVSHNELLVKLVWNNWKYVEMVSGLSFLPFSTC